MLGYGLGLRFPHHAHILENRPKVGWFEIISENYMVAPKGHWDFLADLRQDYPIIMHGVSLSIGADQPLDKDYLAKLKALADFLETPWLSDHLCFTGTATQNTHDLLPIPYTEEALAHLIPRIHQVQEAIGRPIAFENASTYLEFKGSTIPEEELLGELVTRTGCNILLDVNNVYVSSFNHGWDAKAYMDAIPAEAVVQYHLSGHTNKGSHIIDTHDEPVIDEVWDLFRYTLKRMGERSTMIEWDAEIPEFSVLEAEINKAEAVANQVKTERAA